MKPLVVGSFFVAAMGALLWAGWMSASIPVVKVAELQATSHTGTVEVKDAKVVFIESLAPLRFKVSPRNDASAFMWVESPGSIPENFKEGADVGLLGAYNREKNLLAAERITTQCPSKYEASKEAKSAAAAGGYPTSFEGAARAPAQEKPAAVE
jgi:hypothetical protein